MSTLTVQNLTGVSPTKLIRVASGHKLYAPGGVVQVQSTTKTDTWASTSTTFTDVTGLSVSITPTYTTSKILVFGHINCDGSSTVTQVYFRIVRDSTAICIGDAAGSRQRYTGRYYYADNNVAGMCPFSLLDSPSTTSTSTYKIQIATETASGSAVVNRSINDTDGTYNGGRAASTITVMEIAQ